MSKTKIKFHFCSLFTEKANKKTEKRGKGIKIDWTSANNDIEPGPHLRANIVRNTFLYTSYNNLERMACARRPIVDLVVVSIVLYM